MRRPSLVAAIAMLVLSLGATPVRALCFKQTVQKDSPYHYALALIDSFSYAKSALGRFRPDLTNTEPDNFLSALGDFAYEVKLANKDYECAASMIEGYTTSNQEAIVLSSMGTYHVFTSIMELNNADLAGMLKLLDGKSTLPNIGSFIERQADLRVQTNETWKTLLLATIAATHAFVEFVQVDGEPKPRLNLTSTQREEILGSIRKVFGEAVEGGVKAGQSSLLFSASTLYEFLSNPEWKSRIEQSDRP